MEEFISSFLRRAGMPASAGLSCYITLPITTQLQVKIQLQGENIKAMASSMQRFSFV